MQTPNPRGFPTQSVEASLRESLPPKPEDHWSYDTEKEKRQKATNKALEQLKAALKQGGR
jgi:hypothetical protein